ncbi:uncharacterized protein LOC111250224 isoform X2 [Varroa destructor]|uniref:Uncharacterized protein n=1 Tax=Varroa destructor TaxID=109461 RepID=A0A7M7K3N6_VARDE|nr:uncharacterized protein LOC111250224 isoform X2 [Varroa destructor]
MGLEKFSVIAYAQNPLRNYSVGVTPFRRIRQAATNEMNAMDPGAHTGLGWQGPTAFGSGSTDNASGGPDAALDFSKQAVLPASALAGLTNSPTPAGKPNTGDPMRLWYTVDTDPRTAKEISLEALTYSSIDQSVYIMLQNGMSLMELSDCLRILAKYAKELLKPSRERYKHWNKIPFSKGGVAQKWVRMEGTAPILHQLGYTHETSKGYVFPLTSYGPPLALIKVLSLELAMAAAELSVFYNNRHPKAEVITDMLYSSRPAATTTQNNVTLSGETRNTQPAATGSFNVMDLLSPGLKTIKDTEDPPDDISDANGCLSDCQQVRETGSITSVTSFSFSHSGQTCSDPETVVPQDFSVSRKRKELHSSEPTDLTTNNRESRKDLGRQSQKTNTSSSFDRSAKGRDYSASQRDPYAYAEDLSQPRLENKRDGQPSELNGDGQQQGITQCADNQSQQDIRHGYQQELHKNYQDLQDFRNSYGQYRRFLPDNRLPMQEQLMVSSTALPNLSIFGDMLGSVAQEHKD